MLKKYILLCILTSIFMNYIFSNDFRNIFSYKQISLPTNSNSTILENNLLWKTSNNLSFGVGYTFSNQSNWNSNLYQPNITYTFLPFYVTCGYGFGYYSDSTKFNNFSLDLTSETVEILYGISYKLNCYTNINTTIISPYINYPIDTSNLYGVIYIISDSNGNQLTSYQLKISFLYNKNIKYSLGYFWGNELFENNINAFVKRQFNSYMFDLTYLFNDTNSIKIITEKHLNSDSTSEFTITLLLDNRF